MAAAALGLLFAAPGLASASTTAAPAVAESADGPGHHRHGLGLDLGIVLGIHLGLGGHWHDGGRPGGDGNGGCGLLGC